MKKTLTLLTIALLACTICVFSLTACNLAELLENADYTENAEYTDKDSCMGAIDSFFEETLKDPNFVVTCKNKDDEVQFVETVKGTDSYIVGKNGSQTYVYKKGDYYYWAFVDQDVNDTGETVEIRTYYCSDSSKVDRYYEDAEEYYNNGYCQFMSNIKVVSMLSEEEATFNCKFNGEKTDGVVSATITLDCTAEGGSIKITANSESDLVKTVRIVSNNIADPEDNRDFTLTFEYGSASITLPDTDAWDREAEAKRLRLETNEKAINDRDEFLGSTFAENVKVTVMDVLTFSPILTETIANDIDYVDYGEYKTYAYAKAVDEEDWECYLLMDDGEEKTYTINSESYGDNCYVWFALFISAYDDLVETADFTCEIKNDSMTYNVKVDNKTILSIAVSDKTQDAITQIAVSGIDDEDKQTFIAITLEYDKAELSEPDLSDYTLVSENEEFDATEE